MKGGKRAAVISVAAAEGRGESLCLVPAQQFRLVPGDRLKSLREK